MSVLFFGFDFLFDIFVSWWLYYEIVVWFLIVDFYNYFDLVVIVENWFWEFIGEIWLEGDYYKWCVMCWNGILEDFVIGLMFYWEKFNVFVEMVFYCVGNLFYYWIYLEL